MKKIMVFTIMFFAFTTTVFSQLGIRAGVNMANEIRNFQKEHLKAAFQSSNLTGFQAGLVYQANPANGIGLGLEFGALFSQKGSTFNIGDSGILSSFVNGYKEVNYVEVPLNARFRLSLGNVVGAYASAGVYGGCVVDSKTTIEVANLIKPDEPFKNVTQQKFDDFMARVDYGFSLGLGVEFIEKIQVGFNWSQGLQKKDESKSLLETIQKDGFQITSSLEPKSQNRVFSVSLTYLF